MSSKPPLLLLHAALGSASQLEPLAGFLRAEFDVLTLDFEGHGARAAPARPMRNAYMAENVVEMLDKAIEAAAAGVPPHRKLPDRRSRFPPVTPPRS